MDGHPANQSESPLDSSGPALRGARRILIVRLSHLGDVVHALPVYHALRSGNPGAEIGWVIQDEFAPLVEGLPGLARVFRFGRRAGLGAWLRLRHELLGWSPDWVVDAQGNVKSAMACLVSGAPRRSGLAWGDWTERFAAHVLTERAQPAGGSHAMDRMRALAESLAPAGPLRLDAQVRPEERAAAAEHLAELLPASARGPLWILAPATPGDLRSWPAEHLGPLALGLAKAGGRVLVLSGPAEAELGARLAAEPSLASGPRGVGHLAHWVGQRGLRQLAGLFAAATEMGGRLIACDTGPMHLAAACGLSVRLLAGPQDPARTGPWPLAEQTPVGPRSALRTPGPGPHRAFVLAEGPACAPCCRTRCTHPRGPVCLADMAPEQLLAQLLAETVASGAAAENPLDSRTSQPPMRPKMGG